MNAVENATIAVRVDRLRRIIDQYGGEYDGYHATILQEHGHRYLLVERECHMTGDAVEFSTHPSPSAAFHYSADQESPEDWEPHALIDLDTLLYMRLFRTYEVEVESVHKFLLLENT